MCKKKLFVLLDEGADWDKESHIVAHWTQFNVPVEIESIPKRVEINASEIKTEYLAWVHDLGRTPIGDKTLVKFLMVLDNLSFWWMNSIAIKSPFESDSLYQVFKLRTLEQLYFEHKCSGFIYCGDDRALHKTLQNWCRKLGHPYIRRPLSPKKKVLKKGGVRKWLRKCPFWIQAISFLIKNWFLRYRHIPSISSKRVNQIKNETNPVVVSYFPNIDMEKAKNGQYWSRYWENLHPLLDQLSFKTNWVWFYFESSGFSFKESIPIRDACNKKNPEKNEYFFIEEFLTPRAFSQALKLYLKIYRKGLLLKKVERVFCFPNSKINFFPMMQSQWKAAFFGNIAMEGAMRIAMFDCMAKTLPASPWGLFTWENLSWEFALMSAWRRQGKQTQILASQHGFFRSFDLRLYSDSRDFNEVGGEAIPLPDKLCVNNKEGMSILQEAGFPKDKIAKTEALRYFNLKGKYSIYKKPLPSVGRILLVIMGITEHENRFQFQLLREAVDAGGLQLYSEILIKPHPGLSPDGLKVVHECDFEFEIRDQSLNELWPLVDVVYGAHSTGASWEASWFGIPAISVSPVNSLNLNPLAGLPGACFVASGIDLVQQLKNPKLIKIPEDYFFLNRNLKLWDGLLQD